MTKLISDNHQFDNNLKQSFHQQEQEAFYVIQPRTKGEMMKAVYTKEELRNIDSAIPQYYWDKVDVAIHVMNYNEPHRLGVLQNMEEEAKKRNIHWYEQL